MRPMNAPAPNGANVTAYYHTHGAYDPGYRSEYFSNTNGEDIFLLQKIKKWMDI
ncbi:hypothetical protein [uncultured Gammaproteobacteria bacterium]|nr:hypothetical protein [uncultured Gammaproteobacteria bacterium]